MHLLLILQLFHFYPSNELYETLPFACTGKAYTSNTVPPPRLNVIPSSTFLTLDCSSGVVTTAPKPPGEPIAAQPC